MDSIRCLDEYEGDQKESGSELRAEAMAGTTPVVMISSAVRDLHEHRQAVIDACLRQGMLPKMMEHLAAADDGGLAESMRLVDEADIYLAILGHRYGHIPKGTTKSITHYEYERATRAAVFLG